MKFKQIIPYIVLAFMMLGFSSCVLGGRDDSLSALSEQSSSKGTFYAEKFFPPELDQVLALNTRDDAQRMIFDSFEGRMQLDGGLAYEILRPAMNRLAGYGILFEKNFKPLIGKNFRAVSGIKGDDFYVGVTISDQASLNAILAILSSREEIESSLYDDHKLFGDPVVGIYGLVYDDIMLFSNTRQNLIEASDRHDLRASNIENNPAFVKFEKEVGTSNFFYWFDKVSENGARGAGFNIKGTKIEVNAYSSEPSEMSRIDNKGLARRIFTDNLIGFFEGHDFGAFLEKKMKAQEYGTYESFLKTFESSTGLSFEDDLLDFLHDGYAVSFYDNESVLPGIVFLADASVDVSGAKKVIEGLNLQAESIMNSLQASNDKETVASRKKISIDGGDGYILEIDFGLLLTGGNSEKFVISFGLTGDDLFYVSTYKDFVGSFGGVSAAQLLPANLNGGLGISYISFKPFKVFMDRLFNFRADVANLAGSDLLDFYDKNNTYLNPFENGIFSLKKVDAGVKLEGFLTLE